MRLMLLAVAIAAVLQAQDAVVENAAFALSGVEPYASLVPLFNPASLSYPLGTNTVSPGMMAILYAPAPDIVNALARVRPTLPTSETTVAIRHSGSTVTIPLEILSSTSSSITFVIPLNMPLGGAEIDYTFAGQPTGWTNVNVIPASFGFFTAPGGGLVIAQAVAANGSLSPIGLTTPAQPGQTIRVTGSGLGYNTPVSVTVGGVAATVVAPPPHRATPGIDEIWFQIPAGSAVADGCYVPLIVTYNGTATAISTISKTSTGAPCVHPFQLSVADMAALDNGGSIAVGQIDMSTTLDVATASAASREEYIDLNPIEMTAGELAGGFFPNTTGCSIELSGASVLAVLDGFLYSAEGPSPPDLGTATLQDGATTLSFPDTIPQTTQGPLSNPPAPVIAGGTWTWQTSGSSDLAASSFNFTLPAPFQLSGATPPSFIRTQDQTLTWNGANFDAGAMLTVNLSGNAAPPGSGTASLTCNVPANAGTLTLPSTMLSQFAGSALGTLNLNLAERGSFIPHAQLKLTNGSALLMMVNYYAGEAVPVDIR